MTHRDEIRDKLLSMIAEDRFYPRKSLPSIRELARGFGASTATIQKIVNELKEDGILSAKPGKGLFVRPRFEGAKSKTVGLIGLYTSVNIQKAEVYPGGILIPFKNTIERAGYSVRYFPCWDTDETELITEISEAGLAALALFEINDGMLISALRKLHLPIVSMDCDLRGMGIPSVVFSNTWGAFQATRNLIEQGHRHIVFASIESVRIIGANKYIDSVDEERLLGYRVAMRNAGLKENITRIPFTDPDRDGNLSGVFSRRPSPTAMIVSNGLQLNFIHRFLSGLGFNIPGNLSVIGFNSVETEYAPGRKFASVTIDENAMGVKAAETLMDALRGQTPEQPECVELQTGFVANQSIAVPSGLTRQRLSHSA